MLSFGDKLRSEREKRNTTLQEIAGTTRIGLSYLEALEHNEFEALPGRNFGKLYIRAYAEALGFDPQPLLADYDQEHVRRRRRARELAERAAEAAPAPEPEPRPEPEQQEPVEAEAEPVEPVASGARWKMLVALLAIAGLTIVVWLLLAFFGSEALSEAEPAALPRQEPLVPAPAPPVEDAEPEPVVESVAPGTATLTVSDFGVGRRVVNRRLVDRGDRFEEGDVVFFSTRVLGGEPGATIRHIWLRDGKPVQRVDLEVGGPHWRTHSRKTLWGVGPWAVEARDVRGQVLARADFTVAARS